MYGNRAEDAGSEPAVTDTDAHRRRSSRQGTVVEQLSRYGMQVMPSSFQRRLRLQRQQEVSDSFAPGASERGSITPAERKRILKELFLGNSSHSGLGSVLTSQTTSVPLEQDGVNWALDPMEHEWMIAAVEGNYETLQVFINADPLLLTKKDFISGYSVLHWLAKRGQDETMLELFRHAQSKGILVNVNVRGSGGLTPLHIACMHSHYMVIKLLVGAFSADVDAMDYNGKRAWQYLRGDAPPEMKELLGTWDDEHSAGCAQNQNKNLNNNCATVLDLTLNDEVDRENTVEVNSFNRTRRGGSGRFGSFRKLISSLPFFGNKG